MSDKQEGLGVEVGVDIADSGEPVDGDALIPGNLPVLPLRDMVLYPEIVAPVMVGRESSKRLVDEAVAGNKTIGLVALRDPEIEDPKAADLYSFGTAARIVQMLRFPDGTIRIVVEGLARIRLTKITADSPYFRGEVEVIPPSQSESPKIDALVRNVLASFQQMVEMAPYIPDQLFVAAINISEPDNLADFMASNVNISIEERQELLETTDVESRLEKLVRIINRELAILQMGSKIQEEVQSEMEQGQREFLLRKQLEIIRRELGDSPDEKAEVDELREQLDSLVMPDDARKEAERELGRLERIPSASPEHSVIRSYLDWMLAFPWDKSTPEEIDVNKAAKILDADHYDLDKVKDRILEYLAVKQLSSEIRGPILCFVGPPGVGKTSLGKSIAKATGREFVRLSLGGVRDEAEIRGHRRTYIGSMPGRIVQALRRAGTINPVVMLDEIDKLGADFRGDPAAALLEVLDPEQNKAFRDHYLDVPVDLSRVLFITTANVLDTIPPALLDRMEVLPLPGYTEPDKLQIAKRFLIARQRSEHGLKASQLTITDGALRRVIEDYTREAGVRNLEREIATLARKAARAIASKERRKVTIDERQVPKFLGKRKFQHTLAEEADEVGLATGLAVTGAGGDVLFVEASLVPGKGGLTLTGQLGQVMQESARAAFTYARGRADVLGAEADWWERFDVHIHVPAGAIPKDGPSAGVTMTTALVSALIGKPIRKSVGMTGEVTLRGKVLPVGGIKEKLLAAHRAGLATVIIPRDNEVDLDDVPEFVIKNTEIVLVRHVDEVVQEALGIKGLVKGRGPRRVGKKPKASGARAKSGQRRNQGAPAGRRKGA